MSATRTEPAGVHPPGRRPGREALVDVRRATAVLGGRTFWSNVDATVAAGRPEAPARHTDRHGARP